MEDNMCFMERYLACIEQSGLYLTLSVCMEDSLVCMELDRFVWKTVWFV